MVRSMFIIAAMFLLVLFYAYTGVILFGMVKYGQAVSKWVVDMSRFRPDPNSTYIFLVVLWPIDLKSCLQVGPGL